MNVLDPDDQDVADGAYFEDVVARFRKYIEDKLRREKSPSKCWNYATRDIFPTVFPILCIFVSITQQVYSINVCPCVCIHNAYDRNTFESCLKLDY